jgi:hypothetical protein
LHAYGDFIDIQPPPEQWIVQLAHLADMLLCCADACLSRKVHAELQIEKRDAAVF